MPLVEKIGCNIGAQKFSFFESVLPGTRSKEGKKVCNALTFGATQTKERAVFGNIFNMAQLLLTLAEETGALVESADYKKFDALVGNYGCQITARDLFEKLSDQVLREEAVRVGGLAKEKLALLAGTLKEPQKGGKDRMTKLLCDADLDFEISPALRDLIRSRLLAIINDNRVEGGSEKPFTNLEVLQKKISEITQVKNAFSKGFLSYLVTALQIEESARAVVFVREKAEELCVKGYSRGQIVSRLVGKTFEKTGMGIASVPLLYNTEASLAGVDGTVLLKNKLMLGSDPIKNAIGQTLYLRMPGEAILTDDEVAELDENQPIIVIEGYVKEGVSLAETILDHGFFPLVKENCVHQSQYGKLPKGDPGIINDAEVQEEIEQLKRGTLRLGKFDIDHVYCASVKEERNA